MATTTATSIPANSVGQSQTQGRAAVASSTGATAGSCCRWPESPPSCTSALVWIPTIASILLSFTNWKGIRFSDIEWVGFKNYDQIFTVFQRNFYQALINNTVLLVFLFIFPTALGMFLAYLLDKDIRGTRFFQSIFFTPVVLSLAVVGFMWQSVIYSTENGLATQIFGGGEAIDWLGNQSFLITFGDLRHFQEFRGDSGRDRLAAHRLHHGALPGRAEERRQHPAGSGHCWMAATSGRRSATSSSRRSSRSTSSSR